MHAWFEIQQRYTFQLYSNYLSVSNVRVVFERNWTSLDNQVAFQVDVVWLFDQKINGWIFASKESFWASRENVGPYGAQI